MPSTTSNSTQQETHQYKREANIVEKILLRPKAHHGCKDHSYTQVPRNVRLHQQGFDLPRQQWSLLNRFRTEQGHRGACRRKWRLTDTDLCPCGETQTMSHIVESCPLIKLNSGLSRLHSADEDSVSWLTNYGS